MFQYGFGKWPKLLEYIVIRIAEAIETRKSRIQRSKFVRSVNCSDIQS
jgi:uncharacterized protein YlbG (UPF0298 family)